MTAALPSLGLVNLAPLAPSSARTMSLPWLHRAGAARSLWVNAPQHQLPTFTAVKTVHHHANKCSMQRHLPASFVSKGLQSLLLSSATPTHTFPSASFHTLTRSSLQRSSLKHLTQPRRHFDRHGLNRQSRADYDNWTPSNVNYFSRGSHNRQWGPDDPTLIMVAVIGLNGIVFLLWMSAEDKAQKGDSSQLNFMLNNFTVSWRNINDYRIHTLVTAAFSQREVGHLLFNCLTLYFLGKGVLVALGPKRFGLIYLGGAIASSVAHLASVRMMKPGPRHLAEAKRLQYEYYQRTGQVFPADLLAKQLVIDTPALGASGAAMAESVVFACMFPNTTFLIYFVLPVPAYFAVAGLVAYDVYQAYRARPGDRVGHAAHIGGAVFGALYYYTKLRTLRPY